MDMLSSLPVKSSEVISSKFLFMYLLNVLIAIVFMIPGGRYLDCKCQNRYITFCTVFTVYFFCSTHSNVSCIGHWGIYRVCVLTF